MIEVCHIVKHFGQTAAVDDLSFTVKEGETFVLLGTSGCGKTTTLKMINRLIEPDAGEVMINGKNIRGRAPEILRRRMGYVLQDVGLFPHYTIEENIAIVPNLLKWDKVKIRSRAETLLEKFNLSPDIYLSLYPDQLSGGQKQRVGFARALMANPPILLMDEPLGALDPVTRHQIQKEFKHLDVLKGKTIILVTHDIPEAIELGDRICLMDQGKVQQTGTAIELLLHPENDFVKKFFSYDQFMLQLKALRIKDLLSYFRPAESFSGGQLLSAESDIMESIRQFSNLQQRNKKLIFLDEEKNQYYELSMEDVFMAFQRKTVTDK